MERFSAIIADPAWIMNDSLKMSDVARGAISNYSLMSIADIMQLDINSLADPEGCVLALWVPSALLQEGLNTMKAWGFHHKQTYIWVKTKKDPISEIKSLVPKIAKQLLQTKFKTNEVKSIVSNILDKFNMQNTLAFFMGRLFRQTHEICLIGINNTKIYKKLKDKSQRSVCFAENEKHSKKPDHLHVSLEKMFDGNKLEIFARRQRTGWVCLGNEAPMTEKEDIRVSLNKLKKISNVDFASLSQLIYGYNDEKLFEFWEKLK